MDARTPGRSLIRNSLKNWNQPSVALVRGDWSGLGGTHGSEADSLPLCLNYCDTHVIDSDGARHPT
jgi:hypothetical protein